MKEMALDQGEGCTDDDPGIGLSEGADGELKELREALLERRIQDNEKSDQEECGGDEGVQALEGVMLKMQAIRDMGADLPVEERKSFAANAVRDVRKILLG